MPGLASCASIFASAMKLSLAFFVLGRRHNLTLAFLGAIAVSFGFWLWLSNGPVRMLLMSARISPNGASMARRLSMEIFHEKRDLGARLTRFEEGRPYKNIFVLRTSLARYNPRQLAGYPQIEVKGVKLVFLDEGCRVCVQSDSTDPLSPMTR